MILPILAVLAVHYYAPTPQRAVLNMVHAQPKRQAVVRRVNVVGSYAVVLTSGAMMESSPLSVAILVQHFPFGWQPLDALAFRCELHDHALGARTEELLMRGMPKIGDDGDRYRMCLGRRDGGPRNDVEAVRRLQDGPLVPAVVVSGDWAMGDWYGAGGGQTLWRKHEGRWRLAQGGGGALGVDEMRKHGVPHADWCKFRIVGAKCH